MWQKLYTFFRRIKNVLLGLFFGLFLLSILANTVSPRLTLLIPPFGLLFIPFYIMNIVIFILYILRNKWIAVVSFCLLVFASQYILRDIYFAPSQDKGGLKVMTWNVKNFDLYNWTKNQKTRRQMIRLIDSLNPDILCLQEFHTNAKEQDNIEALKSIGYEDYSFYPSYTQPRTGNQWGLAIFSKHPISQGELLDINPAKSEMNQCMHAQIHAKNKTYDVYCAHFQSIHLDYKDYDYINDVKSEWQMVNYFKSWNILYKILAAYRNRSIQIDNFKNAIAMNDNKDDIILCCDMNDIPNSYSYHQIQSILKDAFREKGRGLSNTIGIPVPLYRIDYIFTSNNLKVNGYERIKTELSDHNIVLSYID